MRATWLPLLFGTVAALLSAGPVHAIDRAAVVVGIDNVSGFPGGVALNGAADRAETIGQALTAAGYAQVVVLTGPRATKAAIKSAIERAIDAVDPDGLVMFVYEGHGIGGDYGDARLLSVDDLPENMASTGMDVERISTGLAAKGAGRKMVVLTDAVHKGTVAGLALTGPVASDWLASDAIVVISATDSGKVSQPGVFQSALIGGVRGQADADQDGAVTLGELQSHLSAQLLTLSGGTMQPARSGGVLDTQPIARVKVDSTAVAAVPSATRKRGRYRSTGIGLAVAGTGMGVASVVMYAVKRPDCLEASTGLICGDSSGYAAYRTAQHAAGWAGGILLVAGAGLSFVDSQRVQVGPGTVRVRGQF